MEEKEKLINTAPDDTAENTQTVETAQAENETAVVADAADVTSETPSTESAHAPDTEAEADGEHCPKKEKGFKAWWARHKPSKRRLIQVYSLLLYNAYIRGFVKGEIFTGLTKTACVPGLNCYSCPGAVAACPLGALQNALTGTGRGGAYFVIGIILLYGLILGRTICGFLCPVGLGQDLLYKLKTPKLKKSRVTRVMSYFKYVLLAVLVIGIPVVYSIDQMVVPGFCKYICPAGTLEGAMMLLLHPSNDSLYAALGALFSWKTILLVCLFTASIFIYRAFCRFFCPLGALYGLFNKFALLGIKVNRSKCIDCGKCVGKCKMDIKHVGDHECINCGECISVCPTKAITWKGSKIFMKNVDDELVKTTPVVAEPTELSAERVSPATAEPATAAFAAMSGGGTFEPTATAETAAVAVPTKPKRKRDLAFWVKLTAIILAAALFIGVFTYVNFFAVADDTVTAEYMFVVDDVNGRDGILSFGIGSGKNPPKMADGGEGTQDSPYTLKSITGMWEVSTYDGAQYFKFETDAAKTYTVHDAPDNLSFKIYYVLAGKMYALYDYRVDGDTFTLSLKQPDGYGNTVGDICYDFTLDCYNGREPVTLSELRGKIVVINFWGTWCGPCVAELPHFESVRAKNDDVEVIAIHSITGSGTAQAYIKDKHWDEWGVIFAQDKLTNQNKDMFTMLGGRNNAYPRTLVLDANGVVRKVFENGIDEEMLTSAIETARVSIA